MPACVPSAFCMLSGTRGGVSCHISGFDRIAYITGECPVDGEELVIIVACLGES
jgi:hypothetical protein